jgi:hypothetical protein
VAPEAWLKLCYPSDSVKTSDYKLKRSDLYHLINTIMPVNHMLRARLDVWGSVLVVGLMFAAVSVMRLLLGWTW